METALYDIHALVFVSEISLVRCANSFDIWYFWYISTPKVALQKYITGQTATRQNRTS